MKKFLLFIIAILTILVPKNVLAQTDNYEPYAVLSEDNTVLTFYYDNRKDIRGGLSVGPFNSTDHQSWYEQRESITKVIFDNSFANCTNLTSTAYWFYRCYKITSIDNLRNLSTANVTSMANMFYGCFSLTNPDVSGFKTDNVTNMAYMFYGCENLTNLDVSGFNTYNVTTMELMFGHCIKLNNLDVSGFKTDNVTNMAGMFALCKMKNLDVSGFKTDNVTNMGNMFSFCSNLETLDLSGFNTGNVGLMAYMFNSCTNLTSLDLSSFNTANVYSITEMFKDCSNITTIKVGLDWNMTNVKYGGAMFDGCIDLIGGMGTKYNSNHIDHTYAHIDEGTSNPGYFTRGGNYKMYICAKGNGVVSYRNHEIRNNTSEFSVADGASITLTLTPDAGYKVKNLIVNSTDVTTSIINNQYTISNTNSDPNIEVVFEAILHTLSIKATGNGSIKYEETSVRDNTQTFDVIEETSVTLILSPDEGYQLIKFIVNGTVVTSSISDNKYTISNIKDDINVEAEFEAIQHTMSIKAIGNGAITYGKETIRDNTCTYTVNELSSVTITISLDDGYRLYSLIVNDTDATSYVTNNQYTISSIKENTNIEAKFVIQSFDYDGITYDVASYDDKTINVVSGDFGLYAYIPNTFTAHGIEWTVVGVENGVFNNATDLAAIVWEPEYKLTESVNNPNFLLYVKSKDYAPSEISNVIVNNTAKSIVLTDAVNGNNFYCPQDFTAEQIIYEHNYSMKTGYNTCQGWETIVLPYDVSVLTNNQGVELVPYKKWKIGNNQRPFWLYTMDENGWVASDGIKANTPYIICMPNNDFYNVSYNQSGNIAFRASNVIVKASGNISNIKYGHKIFVPNYQCNEQSTEIFALNVNNLINKYTDSDPLEGSAFIKDLRDVKPFEAYMMIDGGAATRTISIFGDDDATGIMDLPLSSDHYGNNKVYTLSGRLIKQCKDDKDMQNLPKGVYIVNGKKVIK